MEEEIRDVVCVDDITGKELPWDAVRKAHEQELKYLRDLGVFAKVDERETNAKYQFTSIDTKWIDTDKAFEWEPVQIRSRIVAREFKERRSTRSVRRDPSIESAEVHDIDSNKSQRDILNESYRRVTCKLPCKSSETCAGEIAGGGQSGRRCWKRWTVED